MRCTFASLLMLSLPMLPAAAELPSESIMPGQRLEGPQLAPESSLPAYLALQPARKVQVDLQPDEVAVQRLPRENEFPQGAPEPPQPPQLTLPVAGSPDGIPWLRLNLPGHNGTVRCVRFARDGQRLVSAADDKSVLLWRQSDASAENAAGWAYERTFRWQVQRGTSGRIYAIDTAPGMVAIAGDGAMGMNGEILLFDPQSAALEASLHDIDQGHLQVVVGLAFPPGDVRDTLFSQSMDGTLVRWRKNDQQLWRTQRLRPPNQSTPSIDDALARRLLGGRSWSPIVAIDAERVVCPAYAGLRANRITWRLDMYNAADSSHRPLTSDENVGLHWDYVTALTCSGDGRRLASASAGANGIVYLWDVSRPNAKPVPLVNVGGEVLALALDATGQRLAVGTTRSGASSATLQLWDVSNISTPRRIERLPAASTINACTFSPDSETVAWCSDQRVFTTSLRDNHQSELGTGWSPPLKIAFPVDEPYYNFGFGGDEGLDGKPTINRVFDTEVLRLSQIGQADATKWLPEGWLRRGWEVRQITNENGQSELWFFEGNQRRSQIELRVEMQGRMTAVCWIPARNEGDSPIAAIGTSGGSINLYRTTREGMAPQVRQFRGPGGQISSLAISRDLRYLGSASLDGLICLYPLDGLRDDAPLEQRWGADLQVIDNQLVAVQVRPEGQLFFRGIRSGDRITEIRYVDGTETKRLNQPVEMQTALADMDWNTIVTYRFERGREAAQEFQIYPAWQQLVSLFASGDDEWAYWTPAGFYDASFEGHRLFGWQFNRGLELLPDYFLAAQFRGQLERPRAMSQLLRAGNLEEAFRGANLEPPGDSTGAIANAYRLKPDVVILNPLNSQQVSGDVKLTAQVTVDAAERITSPKAFAGGVVAASRRLLSETLEGNRRKYLFEWDLPLPADRQVLVQVVASTDTEISGSDQVVLENKSRQGDIRPRLYFLSVGVDRYQDAQIPKLSTAVQSTQDLLHLLEQRTSEIYRLDAAALIDERATKPGWRFLTTEVARQLAEDVKPDDLLIVFLSGHGFQGPGTGYQFVTADAKYADVLAGKYDRCLSLSDFDLFASIPCRKLVILNTCHGGEVQPLMHRELKAAVRTLQDDLLFTLAASGGEQEAVEGRFARRLLEALDGHADENNDGIVSLSETIEYVQHKVAEDSLADRVRQMPAAGPKELLRYVRIPLTESNKSAASVPNGDRLSAHITVASTSDTGDQSTNHED